MNKIFCFCWTSILPYPWNNFENWTQ